MNQNIETTALSSAEQRLRNGAIAPLFRKYAIPGVITLLFLGLQTIIDGIVLGNFVGANALASVSLILPSYSLICAIAVVIGVGCQTVISIRLGEQNKQGASDAFRSGFLFLIAFSVGISLITYMLAPQIARLLGTNDVLFQGAVNYFKALIPFFPCIVAMFFSDLILKALGHPIYSMIIMSSTVILNIILDLVFIALWEMGTSGAGLATGISFTVGALFNFPLVFWGQKLISFKKGIFSWKLLGKMMYNGSSEGLSELSAGISTLLFNLTLMKYWGESGVAAFTAINYVYFIGIIIFVGISDGVIPIVSYNYGAQQWARIKQVLRLAFISNLAIGIIIFLALTVFGEQIISLFFKTTEVDILKIATHGTSIYAFAFFLNGLNILSSSYFTAMANAKLSVIISLLRGLIFIIIGINILPLIFGIKGIWAAVPLAELLTFFVAFYLVKRSFKKNLHSPKDALQF